MPPITDPFAVQFCDRRVRVVASTFITAYESAKKFVDEWNNLSIGTLIPNTTDVVEDNAGRDFRPLLTGVKANDMLTMAQAIITAFETGTPTRIAKLRAIDLTGASRF